MTYDPTNEERALGRGLSTAQLQSLQERFGIPNAEIAELSTGELARALRKLELPDQPRARVEFERLFEAGDRGEAAVGDKERALRDLTEMRALQTPGQETAGVPGGPDVAPESLSPAPVEPFELDADAGPDLGLGAGLSPTGAGWTSLGPGRVGGRTRCIVVHPEDPDRIWAGSVGGGVWLTTNGGDNWHPVDDRMANLAVSCMILDPANPRILYAGTGEGFSNIGAARGAGIFRTVNGTAWDVLPSTGNENFHYVNRLAISDDGEVLLAATSEGIFRSDDPDRAQWTEVFSGNVADVAFAPGDPTRAVAGGLRDGAVRVSDDGGVTWRQAAGLAGSGRVEVTFAAADPDVVYASLDRSGGMIFRSSDGGQTFAPRDADGPNGFAAQYLGQQGWYDNVIWAGDPTDADLVLVGGIDLWRSRDGGDTLVPISNWRRDASAHADHHVIVAHPDYDGGANRTVFFGNDGGIYRTDDVTTVGSDPERVQGWVNLVNGYAVTQFYGAAGNADTGVIVGGAQDNGSVSYRPADGPSGWKTFLGGDGGYCAADPDDPDIFYTEYVHLDVHRNSHGGIQGPRWWKDYISGRFYNEAIQDWDLKPLPFQIPDARSGRSLFIAPFVLDPNEPQRILAGGRDLWRTDDARTPNTDSSGPSWRSVKPAVGSFISSIAVAEGDSDLVWVGHVNGEVYRSRDATSPEPDWDLVSGSASGLTVRRMSTRLVVDPSDHDRVYATFAGYQADNVWITEDGGDSWRSLAGSLPEMPVRTLAIHPRRPSFLYLGTELGIFTSEDFGTTWSPTNEGPTSCSVTELFWMGEVLICATHGRGMFSIDLGGIPDGP